MNAIELYKSSSGETQVEVRFENETVWLSLNQISELFGRDKSVISRHLKNIYKESELDYSSTVAKNATVQTEGGIGDESDPVPPIQNDPHSPKLN